MEKELSHFSHEHTLILIKVQKKDNDNDDHKEFSCYGCQKQIWDSEAYSCTPCHVFLHKRCAELPLKIWHPLHSPHPLVLLNQGGVICDACHQGDGKFFTYRCSSCDFDLDATCATVERKFEEEIVDRRFEHKCHEHPLILQQRPASFFCDACFTTEDEDSPSYLCTTCPFWVHKRCALLPGKVYHKDHNHSLLLAYSLPSQHPSFWQYCPVCRGRVLPDRWVYYCGPCRYFVHVKCVQIAPDTGQQNEDIKEDLWACKQNLVRLPSTHATQELITHCLLKRDQSSSDSSSETEIREKVVVEDHKHPLILSKKVQTKHEIKNTEEEEAVLVCDRCIEPVSLSDPHYTCEECYGYFLHVTCFKLPPELQNPKHPDHPLSLMYSPRYVGYFRCKACGRVSNGHFYECDPCGLRICIKCASASMTPSVAHDAHKHPLTQFESSDSQACSVCGYPLSGTFGFACEDCHFYMGYERAQFPPTIKQRWDKHPLILTCPPYPDHPDEFYCVLCE